MGTTLADKNAALAPDRRAGIEAEADRLHSEYVTLRELRRAKGLTQAKVAETLGIRQASVAQLERRSDLMLSTLGGYIEAMGGKLKLVVEFPGRPPVVLDGLCDIDAAPGNGNRRESDQLEPTE